MPRIGCWRAWGSETPSRAGSGSAVQELCDLRGHQRRMREGHHVPPGRQGDRTASRAPGVRDRRGPDRRADTIVTTAEHQDPGSRVAQGVVDPVAARDVHGPAHGAQAGPAVLPQQNGHLLRGLVPRGGQPPGDQSGPRGSGGIGGGSYQYEAGDAGWVHRGDVRRDLATGRVPEDDDPPRGLLHARGQGRCQTLRGQSPAAWCRFAVPREHSRRGSAGSTGQSIKGRCPGQRRGPVLESPGLPQTRSSPAQAAVPPREIVGQVITLLTTSRVRSITDARGPAMRFVVIELPAEGCGCVGAIASAARTA
jgi:hypothetical protein